MLRCLAACLRRIANRGVGQAIAPLDLLLVKCPLLRCMTPVGMLLVWSWTLDLRLWARTADGRPTLERRRALLAGSDMLERLCPLGSQAFRLKRRPNNASIGLGINRRSYMPRLMSFPEDAVGARASWSAHTIHRQHTHEQICLHECSAVPLTFFEITVVGYETHHCTRSLQSVYIQCYTMPINSILLTCVTYLGAQMKLKKTICPSHLNSLYSSICLNPSQANETSFNQQCYVTGRHTITTDSGV